MSWLTSQEVWQKLSNYKADHQKNYLGFYSSRLGGFCQDPSAMLIPLDDHMVHRGDGIFEAFRVVDGALIDVDAHLARLHESAKAVGLVVRWSDDEIRRLCLQLVRLCAQRESLGSDRSTYSAHTVASAGSSASVQSGSMRLSREHSDHKDSDHKHSAGVRSKDEHFGARRSDGKQIEGSQSKADSSKCGIGDGLIRLFVSRGEGSFSPNPLDSVEAELYIVMTKFKPPAPELIKRGALVVSSKWVWKEAPFAQIKSCNYLLNVFLKHEANEAKVHFAAAFDAQGFLAESSTENIIVVVKNERSEVDCGEDQNGIRVGGGGGDSDGNQDGDGNGDDGGEENGDGNGGGKVNGGNSQTLMKAPALISSNFKILVPNWNHILRGTTLLWVIELSKKNGFVVEHVNISREMIRDCTEAAIVGTTWGVLPIGQWDGKKLGGFSDEVGPVCTHLRNLLSEAIKTDVNRRHLS